MLTARTKTIERTGTGRQFLPFLASLSATKFSLQIYMELTGLPLVSFFVSSCPVCLFKLYYQLKTVFHLANLFARTEKTEQLDWLVTNTDDITSQSHSLFACSREQIRQVENLHLISGWDFSPAI